MPFAREHDLVALGVGAHGEVGRFAGLVGHCLVAQDATSGNEFDGSGEDIGDLEGEAGPGGFVFAAAVDAERGSGDVEFGEICILAGDFRTEERGIEIHGAGEVLGPDDVFETFDGHSDFMKAAREEMPQLNFDFDVTADRQALDCRDNVVDFHFDPRPRC